MADMAAPHIVMKIISAILLVRLVSGQTFATNFHLTMHQKQLGTSIINDNTFDEIVVINIGNTSTAVYYIDYRTGKWFGGNITVTSVQYSELSLDSRMLIAYGSNDEHLVISISSYTSKIKLIAYNRVIPQTGMDAFLPLPTDYGAQEYYVICFKPPTGNVQVSVVPLSLNTTVTYTMPPTNPVTIRNDNGHFNGITSFAALQVHITTVFFKDAHLFDSTSNLNGLKITSNQLINVFVSSSLSYYSTVLDADFTQNPMVPVKYWSVSYLVKIQNVNSDRIFITSAYSSTSINIAAETPSQYCYFFNVTTPGQVIDILAREPSYYIYATNPIAVAHLIVPPSQSYSMYMLMAIENFVTVEYFFVPLYFQLMTNYLTVYTNTTMTGLVTLNNLPLTGSWSVIPGSGFSAVTVTVQTNTLYTVATSGGGVIGGYVHGTGTAESYSYPLSTNNRNLQTGCGGANCYQSTTFNFTACPAAPTTTTSTTSAMTSTTTTTMAPTTTTTMTPTTTTTVTPTFTTAVTSAATTAVTSTSTTATTTIPTIQEIQTYSRFCSDVGMRFFLGQEFLGSLSLNFSLPYVPRCPCNCTAISTNASILQQRLAELHAILTVDVKDTGAYSRKIRCADDNRPSSAAMGSIITIILTSLLAFVIIIDLTKLIHDGRHCRRLIRDEFRTKCGDPPTDEPLDDPQEEIFFLENMPHVVI